MQRLKTRPQFQAAMAGGTVARTAHFALHRLALDAAGAALPALGTASGPAPSGSAQALFPVDGIWLGAMVPKRWARRAVTRNAIKRQIYGVATALEPPLLPAAHVVRLRAAFDRKLFPSASSEALKLAVRNELQQLFQRAAPRGASPQAGASA
ncbi:ribonuclease P protein component [Acidovorax sp. SRB_14]|uniref:ribonuclease P protein component n=1 Tax=unclassified Acidovorax TaxID=2684926 RepID=UPI00145DC16A|nr:MULTISPECIES: ribonuclease P protein component [unclassified Acidovorax]NMM76682.1 ribonuclease P protein component [Acidovorax sp. SRB_24]NMM81651.1 ribonuclease P protein component [Acidovorax sp. SRB_14]NMM88130.1 ribonuclease P protein component [Rhodococcus sp. SRB_17]